MQTTCLYLSIHILSEYTFNSLYTKIKYIPAKDEQQINYKMQLKSNKYQGINVKHMQDLYTKSQCRKKLEKS